MWTYGTYPHDRWRQASPCYRLSSTAGLAHLLARSASTIAHLTCWSQHPATPCSSTSRRQAAGTIPSPRRRHSSVTYLARSSQTTSPLQGGSCDEDGPERPRSRRIGRDRRICRFCAAVGLESRNHEH